MTTPGDTLIRGATTGFIAGVALSTLARSQRLSEDVIKRRKRAPVSQIDKDIANLKAENPRFNNKKFLDTWFKVSKRSFNMMWDMFDGNGSAMIERLRFDNPTTFRKVLGRIGKSR